jgi:hypothetical protein
VGGFPKSTLFLKKTMKKSIKKAEKEPLFNEIMPFSILGKKIEKHEKLKNMKNAVFGKNPQNSYEN